MVWPAVLTPFTITCITNPRRYPTMTFQPPKSVEHFPSSLLILPSSTCETNVPFDGLKQTRGWRCTEPPSAPLTHKTETLFASELAAESHRAITSHQR